MQKINTINSGRTARLNESLGSSTTSKARSDANSDPLRRSSKEDMLVEDDSVSSPCLSQPYRRPLTIVSSADRFRKQEYGDCESDQVDSTNSGRTQSRQRRSHRTATSSDARPTEARARPTRIRTEYSFQFDVLFPSTASSHSLFAAQQGQGTSRSSANGREGSRRAQRVQLCRSEQGDFLSRQPAAIADETATREQRFRIADRGREGQ